MFTPYYILAVSFGAFATIISLIGIKKSGDESFPGKFATPLMFIALAFGVATFAFVWKGGEEELDHKKHEQEHELQHDENEAEQKSEEGAALPAGVRFNG